LPENVLFFAADRPSQKLCLIVCRDRLRNNCYTGNGEQMLSAIGAITSIFNLRTNMANYTHILDLAQEAAPPADGILSRTIYQDDQIKAVVFGFGQGQELSEHTAAKTALLFFVQGTATVGLGTDLQQAAPGTWVHMPANLKHSIKALTPTVMLLVLLK